MPELIDPSTELPLGDSERAPYSLKDARDDATISEALSMMIVSASGWRAVFADPKAAYRVNDAFPVDFDNSLADAVPGAYAALACCAGASFGAFLAERLGALGRPPRVCVGVDSRPTGPEVANAVMRGLLGRGVEVEYCFIVAAPEIMAHARARASSSAAAERLDGFCYVSASHNPPGHNGLKFGLTSGGVLGAKDSEALAAIFLETVKSPERRVDACARGLEASGKPLSAVLAAAPAAKRRAKSDYMLFAREVATGSPDGQEQEAFFDALASSLSKRPLGIVAEMNGSARAVSIDEDFLSSAGLGVRAVNAAPRAFAHRIVPEGHSLDHCRAELDRVNRDAPEFTLGYVPDCDGDRGNLVWFHPVEEEAISLGAQDTFALCCVAELAHLEASGAFDRDASGKPRARVAVAVNDATSLRIEAICAAFGAEAHRAETGEANVVELAETLRASGAIVRVLGEGSNGGNITHPSKVRDPIATVIAIAKLLRLPRGDGAPLLQTWFDFARKAGIDAPREAPLDASLADVLPTLPRYATTSVFEERAALRVRSKDHAALKRAYQGIFERQWPTMARELAARLGCTRYIAVASGGPRERRGIVDFGESGTGGLRLEFFGEGRDIPRAFVWMRGSKTEPAFRVMADAAGGRADDEEYLLSRHVAMLKEADEAACGA
jgi:phosphoglucomutase